MNLKKDFNDNLLQLHSCYKQYGQVFLPTLNDVYKHTSVPNLHRFHSRSCRTIL